MSPTEGPEADRLREALREFATPENWEPITVRDEGQEHEVWAWNNYRTPYEFAAAALRDRAGVPPPQDRAGSGVVAAKVEGKIVNEEPSHSVSWEDAQAIARDLHRGYWREKRRAEALAAALAKHHCRSLFGGGAVWCSDHGTYHTPDIDAALEQAARAAGARPAPVPLSPLVWDCGCKVYLATRVLEHCDQHSARPAPVPLARAPRDWKAMPSVEGQEFAYRVMYLADAKPLTDHAALQMRLDIAHEYDAAIAAASPASRSSGPTDPDRA